MSVLAALGRPPAAGEPASPQAPDVQRGTRRLLLPGVLYLVVFFVVPVGVLLATSFYARVPGGEIGEFAPALRWQNYPEALAKFWPQLSRSFGFAAVATLAALVVGYPMAYVIAVRARGRPGLQGLLVVLVVAPFFTSFILRTVAWKQILADGGQVVAALRWLHVLPPDGRLSAAPAAVVIGLTYSFLPFMVLPLFASLERLDPRLLEAGSDLYASPLTTFRTVTLPLSLPGVVAGTLLTFIPAVGDYVNSSLLGNNTTTTMVGQVIEQRFFRTVDYPTAAVLSVVLMVSILTLVTLYVRRAGTRDLV
ncbi:ABC transporter permease [Cellulomonas xiejunii]|uniref:ABC transporter permease n=1 Tax=Cellulomonas xiejunii TaxID=2968083 RepID=A0ABY5KU45_9CELL|nr:ABC transporter permease [Cellulomonas xiejunii]MCC2315378.1 ABC transporter permease [Cellulomonas xiejunii]MCC2321961.1 ABC transporter permease [Cellulomonas xiejunii]UUI73260.1 ABC transporter permease [Cellulomonas xiejunii]